MKKRLLSTLPKKVMLTLISLHGLAYANDGINHAGAGSGETDFYHFQQAGIVIKGTVKDQDGNPLPGATITEQGTNHTAVSGANGSYSITVKEGAVLVISYVGFETQTIKLTDKRDIDVLLRLQEKVGSEVVVTALGIKKEKAKISYATQEVKGTALEKAAEPNVANNLVGKVAGLNILSKSNLFENPEIFLRGEATLVVVDGVPTDKDNFNFWNLNPNDIESVNVLKGTSAAALYGALGINGAIMITTKKGKGGGKGVEVTYNSTTQFQAGFLRVPETQDQYGMGFGGYYAFTNGKGGEGWYDDYGYVWGPKLNVRNPNTASGYNEYPQYNSEYDPDNFFPFSQAGSDGESHYKPMAGITRGKNNLKNFLENELITTHNISVAGKNENADYRISLTHMYQKGQVPNTKLNSTTLSLAGGLKVGSKLKLESTFSYNKQYTPNYPTTGYGANNFFYNILLWMGPDVDIRDLQNYWKPGGGRIDANTGDYVAYGVKDIQQYNYNYTWYNNPWYLANEYMNGYDNDVITAQVNGSWDIAKGLSFFVRSGIITNNSISKIETPKSFVWYGLTDLDGNYSETRRNNFQIVTDALLTYKKTFFDDFNTTISVGGSNRYNTSSYLTSQTNGLNVPEVYNLDNTIGPVRSVDRLAEKKVNSYFAYLDLDYKQMAYISLTGRKDFTSSLQKPNNAYFYPSASVGIVPTNMFQLPEFISYIKLRGSWSKVSTDIINIYPTIYENWYATLPFYLTGPRWNANNASLNLPGTLIQPGLRPNTTISQEYGTELKFLKNRLGIDFTYFTYIDKDFAIQAPVSSASGYNAQLVNGDRINRRGFEVILTGTPLKLKDFRWDVLVNWSTVQKIAKEWYGGDSIRNGVKVGERVDVYRGWTWETSPDGKTVYNDNGYPQYIDHVVNLGNTDPNYTFGFTNNFSYKNIGLSFSFDGRVGGVMANGLEQKLFEGGMHPETANHYRDEAYDGQSTYVGQGVVVTSGSVEYDIQGNPINDTRKFAPNEKAVNYVDWIFNTYVFGIDGANMDKRTFMKLREVVITYTAPSKWLRNTLLTSASISLTGRNLILFTNVPFMDPDGYSGWSLAEPSYRNIGFNLNLKF